MKCDEYRVGKTIWKFYQMFESGKKIYKHNYDILDEKTLIDMGATPCGKCGEREEIELCPKCGAESYGNCPCKPKEEKIEMPKSPMIGVVADDDGRVDVSVAMGDWMRKMNDQINNLTTIFNNHIGSK